MIILLFSHQIFYGQDGFSRIYPLSYSLSDFPRSMEIYDNEIYLGLSHLCVNEMNELNFCGSLLKLDESGNMLDSLVEYGFNVGNENVLEFKNDSIFLFGYDTKSSFNNRQEIEVLSSPKIFGSPKKVTINLQPYVNEFFLNGILRVNDQNWLYGNGNGNSLDSTGVQGMIFRVDEYYKNVDDLVRIEQCTLENHVLDLRKFDSDHLIFANYPFYESIGDRKAIVNKLNENGELVGSYSLILGSGSFRPNLGLLKNNDIVFSMVGDPFKKEKVISCIDGEMFEEKWVVRIPSSNGSDFWWIEIMSILPLSNSDFLVIGQKRNNPNSGFGFGGYVIRISSDGDILWEKTINPKTFGEFQDGVFRKAVELSTGEIIVAGEISSGVIDNVSTSDLWIVKMDADGCIGIDDCGQNTYTSTSSIVKSSDVRLSPNPVVNVLFLNSSEIIFNGFSIFDLTGNLRRNSTFSGTSKYKVDTSDLAPGIYFLVIKDSYGHTISIEKFVKQE